MAALGVARAQLSDQAASRVPGPDGSAAASELAELLLRVQRELFVVGAELASNPDARDRLQDGVTRVSEPMVVGLETILADVERRIEMPREFVVPGETPSSAALELARTIVRRSERRAIALRREGLVVGEWLIPYLNRLADLLWVIARAAEQAEHRAATPSRRGGRCSSVGRG